MASSGAGAADFRLGPIRVQNASSRTYATAAAAMVSQLGNAGADAVLATVAFRFRIPPEADFGLRTVAATGRRRRRLSPSFRGTWTRAARREG